MSWLLSLLLLSSLSAIIGSILGGIAGLVPGLHPNAIAALMAGSPQLFAFSTFEFGPGQPDQLCASAVIVSCFMVGVLIGHSLTEIIPTATLGVSNDDTVVVQLPSQRLYALGRADLVLEAAMIGGIGAVALSAIIFVPTRLVMGSPIGLYAQLRPIMGFLLIGISSALILRAGSARKAAHALATFLSAGALGIFVLSLQIPSHISISVFGSAWPADPSSFLLPAFSGFFAVPALVLSTKGTMRTSTPLISGGRPRVPLARSIFRSTLPSILVGWLPGITNAYAASLANPRGQPDGKSVESSFGYLVTYSATNVGGSLQSIIAMTTIFRARNGTLEAVNDHLSIAAIGWFDPLQPPITMLSFFWAACVAAVVGALLCKHLGQRILCRHRNRSFGFIRPAVLLFIISLVLWTSGPIGLLIMISCSLLGVGAMLLRAPRIHLMGFLLVPVIVFFFGLSGG